MLREKPFEHLVKKKHLHLNSGGAKKHILQTN